MKIKIRKSEVLSFWYCYYKSKSKNIPRLDGWQISFKILYWIIYIKNIKQLEK